MKSAYELAMERLGGSRSYTNGQKQQMAEIDRKYEARLAEARLRAEDHFRKLGPVTAETADQEKTIRENLARDVTKLEQKREAEKEAVRAGRT
ncbi:MAG: hypothetical protein A2498_02660 [Lentisphaerae bacterium RIFOXYC12_FULL_60_16]|nr:MAG: hypothetical protein A2498_02660 [Lentisphaerae bacterium RIFOXYC12_FULL_60_16]OGV77681.1 MAG: hypothetical protein A2340_11945 [Lentisphaerae bacterium RIFOXYB12_FULL_60_10]